jgi:hypothetical protein
LTCELSIGSGPSGQLLDRATQVNEFRPYDVAARVDLDSSDLDRMRIWADYQRVKHLPGMRPGGFITVYPSPDDPEDPLSRLVLGDEVIWPDAGTESGGAEAMRALAQGEVRRVSDDTPVSSGTMLKTMYEVVVKYFSHGEAKADYPYGAGELARRHIEAVGVDVTSKESNRLAQSAAEDTANVVGALEQFGSRDYGPTEAAAPARPETGRLGKLSSLFDEEMPDLLAASCLSRRTIENVQQATHEPAAETWAALELAMQLLDQTYPEYIAGWRDLITAEGLAELLDSTLRDAQARFQGRKTWRATERDKLVQYLAERRSRLG